MRRVGAAHADGTIVTPCVRCTLTWRVLREQEALSVGFAFRVCIASIAEKRYSEEKHRECAAYAGGGRRQRASSDLLHQAHGDARCMSCALE